MATPRGKELGQDQVVLLHKVIEGILGQRNDVGVCIRRRLRSGNRRGSPEKTQNQRGKRSHDEVLMPGVIEDGVEEVPKMEGRIDVFIEGRWGPPRIEDSLFFGGVERPSLLCRADPLRKGTHALGTRPVRDTWARAARYGH